MRNQEGLIVRNRHNVQTQGGTSTANLAEGSIYVQPTEKSKGTKKMHNGRHWQKEEDGSAVEGEN